MQWGQEVVLKRTIAQLGLFKRSDATFGVTILLGIFLFIILIKKTIKNQYL
jgi:uncharacterized membrane protein